MTIDDYSVDIWVSFVVAEELYRFFVGGKVAVPAGNYVRSAFMDIGTIKGFA